LPTGINLTILDNFSGFNNWGMTTASNSGVVPDNVMQEFYYVQYGETAQLMIDGLNFGDRYNFSFFGSCDNRATGTLVSLYTIGGETVQLDARNNTQNTIQINNVAPDELGRVIITIKSAAPGYGFVNSISIQAVPSATESGGGAFRKSSGNSYPLLNNLQDSSGENYADEQITASVYPVPIVNDIMLRIFLQKPANRLVASLIDNTGRPLYSQELNGLSNGKNERKLNFNGKRLTPGVYFIRITGGNNENLKMIKIVK